MEEVTKPSEDIAVIVDYDNPDNPKVMRISIPINHFAEQDIGTVLLKGFMDDIKEMGLQIIRNKRRVKASGGILTPNATINKTGKLEVVN